MDPRVSVIIATRNRAGMLGASIASVLAQTDRDFELIVVDDGSEDDTRAVVDAFEDSRLRCLVEPPRGLGAALNTGLRAARGRYVARNDSDDIWRPTLLETLVPPLEADRELGLVYGRCDVVSADLQQTLGHRGAPLRYPQDAFCSLLYSDTTTSIGSLYRRSCVEAVGGWSETRRWNDDWGLALRVTRNAPARYLDACVAQIRRHPGSITWEAAETFDERLRSREGVLDEVFSAADLPRAARALRPVAYRNLHTAAGMQRLLAHRYRDALRDFGRAVGAGKTPARSLAYVLWTAFSWFGIGRVPFAAHLARRTIARVRGSSDLR
jgi:hypothetical protein